MLIIAGALSTAVGLFLFLWCRTLAGLPQKLQPRFVRFGLFKWGVPSAGATVFAAGLFLLAQAGPAPVSVGAVLSVLAALALVRFDRYSATMRIIHDHYVRIRRVHGGMTEPEALFLTARWRYPDWSEDRVLELIAGKNIESVILLMIIQENGIHPISDWELYRSLRAKAARIVRAAR